MQSERFRSLAAALAELGVPPLFEDGSAQVPWPSLREQLGEVGFEPAALMLLCLDAGSRKPGKTNLSVYVFVEPASPEEQWEVRRLVGRFETTEVPGIEHFRSERRWRSSSHGILDSIRERLGSGYKPHDLPNPLLAVALLAMSKDCAPIK